MFTWRRKNNSETAVKGNRSPSLVHLGRTHGSSHSEWVRRALLELQGQPGIERAGVWLDDVEVPQDAQGSPAIFHGDVWEREVGCGPREWARLSGDIPVPSETLSAGKSCEYELEGAHSGIILGPAVGLARVLWVPITAERMLRGILLVGSRQKRTPLPRAAAERVAEELSLLLELEEARRLAAVRKADLELETRIQALGREGQSGNVILAQLAESCTRGAELGGVGANFAWFGEIIAPGVADEARNRPQKEIATESTKESREEDLLIRAESGERRYEQSATTGALESLWRHAIDQKRVIGAEAQGLSATKELLRVVAVPIEQGKEIYGVLLAALTQHRATLGALDRLELRASLAAEVLDRERRAKRHRQQEQWYAALLESSGEALVLVDRAGFIRTMSQGARGILPVERAPRGRHGAPRRMESFRPRSAASVLSWVQSAAVETGHLECELTNGKSVVLWRFPVAAGEFVAVRIEGKKDATRAANADEVEEELRQSIEWLEEGVVVFDACNEIRAYNSRFLQILGLTGQQGKIVHNLEDLIRATSGNFASPELFAEEWRILGRTGISGTQEELAMERPFPQVVERNTRSIVASSGKLLGRVEVYREATARRMFQSRMLQAEKLASLGQRVTAIVHELSNPLTTILGTAQRMVLRAETGAQNAEAHRILDEAERATSILRQLLNYSREARPERRFLSLNELVHHTVELQRALSAGHAQRYEVDIAERLPRMNADPGQLQQVLLNLLQNAHQAIQQSGAGSTIGVRTSLAGSDRVRLEVWDDGPGIPEALQARIFDPFFTTKAEGMGTGLGLAIVSGFVRQHGGSIAVLCPPEGGTRFIIELPADEEIRDEGYRHGERRTLQRATLDETSAPAASNIAGRTRPDTRVLVVEDEATVATLIADVLREEGMRVDVLSDGDRALQAARGTPYDLVICDLKMPGMSGQTFFEQLQQEQSPLRKRILFVTGDVLSPRTHEFLERNQLPHVAKPFRVEELSDAVRRMLWGGIRAAAAGAESRDALGNGMRP